MQIINEEFEFSKLLFKNKKILIIWYKYEEDTNYADMEITDYQLYDLSQDEEIIKNDFYIIKDMVVKGEAHNISEGQTSYLGACTKAATSADRTQQPNSTEPAKPRAFCLKNSYMTGIFRILLFGNQINTEIATYMTIKEYVFNILKHYIGKTQLEMYNMITGEDYTNRIPKNISKMISDRLIGKDDELEDKNELFKKTTYVIKNLPIFPNKEPVERMSFRNLRISEFEKDWEESEWKQYFEEVTLLVICYEAKDKTVKNGYRILKEIRTISFTDKDLEALKKGYEMVQEAIKKNDISLLPYPNSYENQIIEIAPKGVKGDDAYNNFFKKDTTKTTFMLSKNFLEKKLENK